MGVRTNAFLETVDLVLVGLRGPKCRLSNLNLYTANGDTPRKCVTSKYI